jgi:hypothetical protein
VPPRKVFVPFANEIANGRVDMNTAGWAEEPHAKAVPVHVRQVNGRRRGSEVQAYGSAAAIAVPSNVSHSPIVEETGLGYHPRYMSTSTT